VPGFAERGPRQNASLSSAWYFALSKHLGTRQSLCFRLWW
jgi:hypothetical protein